METYYILIPLFNNPYFIMFLEKVLCKVLCGRYGISKDIKR